MPDTPRQSTPDCRAETCDKVCQKCFQVDKDRRMAIERSAAVLGDRSNAVKPAPRTSKPTELEALLIFGSSASASALPVLATETPLSADRAR